MHPLTKSLAMLEAYNTKELIEPLGQFKATITLGQHSTTAEIVVIESITQKVDNLLSYSTLLALNVDFNAVFNPNFKTPQINAIEPRWEDSSHIPNMTMISYLDHHSYATMNEAIRAHPKYKPLFEHRIGKLPSLSVSLDVDKGVKPVRCPMQSIPYFMQQATIDKLKTWLTNGVISKIEPGTRLSWLSSINPVEKLFYFIILSFNLLARNEP